MDTSNYRGTSVYRVIEADGWKSIKSPHCMRWADCFRKGNRRAYVGSDRDEQNRTFYCAVEAQPSIDSFGQRYWKEIGMIAFDGNYPEDLKQKRMTNLQEHQS